MREEKVKKLLNELADATPESVRPGLAEEIKDQIPHRLGHHRGGMDTINILIDLRISRLTAAAAIIITIVLCAHFLGGRDATGRGIYEGIRYWWSWAGLGRSNVLAAKAKYEDLAQQGKQVWYYGDSIDPADSEAVLVQWKLDDGRYRVVFADWSTEAVSAEDLAELLSRMLQKKAK
jgi:hypothetical protein